MDFSRCFYPVVFKIYNSILPKRWIRNTEAERLWLEQEQGSSHHGGLWGGSSNPWRCTKHKGKTWLVYMGKVCCLLSTQSDSIALNGGKVIVRRYMLLQCKQREAWLKDFPWNNQLSEYKNWQYPWIMHWQPGLYWPQWCISRGEPWWAENKKHIYKK